MPDPHLPSNPEAEVYWRNLLLYGRSPGEQRLRPILERLPSDPRCKVCLTPFKGFGAWITRTVLGTRPSRFNPHICNYCEEHLSEHVGGANVEVSLLFADVRGSTTLAEHMEIKDYSTLIDRFYQAGAKALIEGDAIIDKLIGDEVSGGFAPGIAGQRHAYKAIEAAREILRMTGYADPEGPWIPVGIGVHTGTTYVGTVGSLDGVMDVTFLGDSPNTTARLASLANAGEILVSESAWQSAGGDFKEVEQRSLQVKGRTEPVQVHVLHLQEN